MASLHVGRHADGQHHEYLIFGLAHTSSLGEGLYYQLGRSHRALGKLVYFKEKLSKAAWIALPLAILGMALLSLRHGFTFGAKQVYFFCAALLLSVTFIFKQPPPPKLLRWH